MTIIKKSTGSSRGMDGSGSEIECQRGACRPVIPGTEECRQKEAFIMMVSGFLLLLIVLGVGGWFLYKYMDDRKWS